MSEQPPGPADHTAAPDQAATSRSSVDISVDTERVWQALVTDRGLEPWMGEGASIEPRIDGELRLPDVVGGRPRRGHVERVEEFHRLDFAWWPEHRPIERSHVSITLVPLETGTRVTVTETVPRSIARSIDARLSSSAPCHVRLGRSSHAAPVVGLPTEVHRRPLVGPPVTGLVGAWSWRLALLSLACQAVRV